MMKKFGKLLSLTLCAAMLCTLPAFAAEENGTPGVRPGPARFWGTVTRLEDGSWDVQNSNPNDPHGEVILRLAEHAAVVDAVSGLPMAPADIRDGDTVYAWGDAVVTLSLPPQATAKVVVANIPAGFSAPQFCQVLDLVPQAVIAIYPAPPLRRVEAKLAGGGTLVLTDRTALSPYRTRNLVTLESIRPGTELLVWKDAAGNAAKAVVFPYAYKGYVSSHEKAGEVRLNGELLPVSGKVEYPATPIGSLAVAQNGWSYSSLLPIRAVAEAMGLEVRWDAEKGAVVSEGGNVLFTAKPGEAAVNADGESQYGGDCIYENGVTYLPEFTLAALLDLFVAG